MESFDRFGKNWDSVQKYLLMPHEIKNGNDRTQKSVSHEKLTISV